MDHAAHAELLLADWRRALTTLYAEVRQLAVSDPLAAVLHWRTSREYLYRWHPMSPVPPPIRATFRAHHFPYDRSLRCEVSVLPDDAGPLMASGTTVVYASRAGSATSGPPPRAQTVRLRRLGWVAVPLPTGPRRLAIYWRDDAMGGLVLGFRDATNGVQTDADGRYLLDGAQGADLGGDIQRQTLVLDFNFAYQPDGAFDPRRESACVPPENSLDVPLAAGECMA